MIFIPPPQQLRPTAKRDQGKTGGKLILLLLLPLSGKKRAGKPAGKPAVDGRTKGWLDAVGWDKRPHTHTALRHLYSGRRHGEKNGMAW